MISELQSETSRINGAKSRGPKSAITRAISSLNALKHGFTAHNTVLLACESPEEYQRTLDDYKAAYRPSGAMQNRMVEEMFAAHWRIRRLKSIETALLDFEMARQEPEMKKKVANPDVALQLAMAFTALVDESRALALISRYESRLHRIHDRILATLLAIRQPAKASKPILPQSEIKNDETNPAPIPWPVPEPSK